MRFSTKSKGDEVSFVIVSCHRLTKVPSRICRSFPCEPIRALVLSQEGTTADLLPAFYRIMRAGLVSARRMKDMPRSWSKLAVGTGLASGLVEMLNMLAELAVSANEDLSS